MQHEATPNYLANCQQIKNTATQTRKTTTAFMVFSSFRIISLICLSESVNGVRIARRSCRKNSLTGIK
jgi:hypothetical protein